MRPAAPPATAPGERGLSDRLFRLAPFALGAFLVAGVVHIAIVLLVPGLAASNAAIRLMQGARVNALEILRPVQAGEQPPIPFADPALVTALCRFDIEDGPVRLRVPTGDAFLSVVLLSPRGRVLLALTDRAATRRLLNIVLLTAEQQRRLERDDPDDEPVQELRLRLSETRGVAVVRTLALRESEKRPLEAALGRAGCGQD